MTKSSLGILAAILLASTAVTAQTHQMTDEERRAHLAEISEVEEMIMVEMRDGVRVATDVYLPEGRDGPVPVIFWRTPYDFNTMQGTRLKFAYESLKRGYAFVIQNERGQFFSEGDWEILARPRTDGWDALEWIDDQSWSSGKVGTIGCSSSAEWQLALAAMDHPTHAAMVPMASGAGIGRVGDWYEQGNWFRGGVFQMLFAVWLYGVQNEGRPLLAKDLTQEQRVQMKRYFDLVPDIPEVDWHEQIKHLPLIEMLEDISSRAGPFEDMMDRTPNDPKWYEGGLYHDNEDWGVPAFWFNSWYDVSIGPNLALATHVAENASDRDVRDNQYVLVAPTVHCDFDIQDTPKIVGERDMGDPSFDLYGQVFDWFGMWLKDEDTGFRQRTDKIQYYAMGENVWRGTDQWPPEDAKPMTLYLQSGGRANSLYGDGTLTSEPAEAVGVDSFTYDPMNPVISLGGGVCCTGDAVQPGSFDQRPSQARADILVYTSDPLEEDLEIAGWVETILHVSSDVKDTDFTVKLVDVAPDGTAYNIDESIQRARWREGYDAAPQFMEPGEVYELSVGPMVTSAVFKKGHRIRIEVSSSNFPRFARNLNTGGKNYDETEHVVAENAVHHSSVHPSRIILPVMP